MWKFLYICGQFFICIISSFVFQVFPPIISSSNQAYNKLISVFHQPLFLLFYKISRGSTYLIRHSIVAHSWLKITKYEYMIVLVRYGFVLHRVPEEVVDWMTMHVVWVWNCKNRDRNNSEVLNLRLLDIFFVGFWNINSRHFRQKNPSLLS